MANGVFLWVALTGLLCRPFYETERAILCYTDAFALLTFRYASPRLWNQLPTSLRQPHPSLSISDSPFPAPTTSSVYVDSSCTLAIHNSLTLSLPPQNLPFSQIFPTI